MKLTRLIASLLACGLIASHAQEEAKPPNKAEVEAPAAKPGEDPLNKLDLAGVTINAKERYVDVDSVVCLDGGALELIATLKDSKEHESIISVLAKPVHIHMALLLVGAKAGNPAMQKPIGEGEDKRWVFIPARGQKVHVSLVIKDEQGNPLEKPIADFICHVSDEAAFIEQLNHPGKKVEEKKFPTSEFLFVGSHLIDAGEGQPRRYIAEESGNVISISTFGDEMLGMSEHFGHVNGSLVWEIDTDVLPKLGTPVTLRLRPVFN
ncbi:MAG: YdjY domain-containing protein [Luteolibacter sp.]|jgi:hypothetical protein